MKKYGEHIKAVCKKYKVKRLYLFGSAVDDIKTANDYDLALAGYRGKKFFKIAANLERPLDKESDLLDYDYYKKINNPLYQIIDRDGVIIYGI